MRLVPLACALLANLLLAVLLLAGGPVWAQPAEAPGNPAERRAAARALFDEGLKHSDAERWSEAAESFQRAYALRPSAEIGYNLAMALTRLKRLVDASELFRGIVRDPSTNAKVREASQVRLDEVTRRLGWMSVRAHGNARGGDVMVDGKPLARALTGVAFPIDPGEHVVEAWRGDRLLARRSVQVGEAEQVTVELHPLSPATTSESAREVATGSADARLSRPLIEEAQPRTPLTRRWWFWAAALGAVAAGGIASAQLLARDPPPVKANLMTWTLK